MDLDTEFGVYYLNLHNNTPIISAYNWAVDPRPSEEGVSPLDLVLPGPRLIATAIQLMVHG